MLIDVLHSAVVIVIKNFGSIPVNYGQQVFKCLVGIEARRPNAKSSQPTESREKSSHFTSLSFERNPSSKSMSG